ncbi:hypothetical protein A1351_18375 [Methylosinus sp. R-45379]|nr:hypothetical protein A1351_18375 [Methylosinus sp. R-45379]
MSRSPIANDRTPFPRLRIDSAHITLDIDDTFGAVRGGQPLRLFKTWPDRSLFRRPRYVWPWGANFGDGRTKGTGNS